MALELELEPLPNPNPLPPPPLNRPRSNSQSTAAAVVHHAITPRNRVFLDDEYQHVVVREHHPHPHHPQQQQQQQPQQNLLRGLNVAGLAWTLLTSSLFGTLWVSQHDNNYFYNHHHIEDDSIITTNTTTRTKNHPTPRLFDNNNNTVSYHDWLRWLVQHSSSRSSRSSSSSSSSTSSNTSNCIGHGVIVTGITVLTQILGAYWIDQRAAVVIPTVPPSSSSSSPPFAAWREETNHHPTTHTSTNKHELYSKHHHRRRAGGPPLPRSEWTGWSGGLLVLGFVAPFFALWNNTDSRTDGSALLSTSTTSSSSSSLSSTTTRLISSLSISLYSSAAALASMVIHSSVTDLHRMTPPARIQYLASSQVLNSLGSLLLTRILLMILYPLDNNIHDPHPHHHWLVLSLAGLAGLLFAVAQSIIRRTRYSNSNNNPTVLNHHHHPSPRGGLQRRWQRGRWWGWRRFCPTWTLRRQQQPQKRPVTIPSSSSFSPRLRVTALKSGGHHKRHNSSSNTAAAHGHFYDYYYDSLSYVSDSIHHHWLQCCQVAQDFRSHGNFWAWTCMEVALAVQGTLSRYGLQILLLFEPNFQPHHVSPPAGTTPTHNHNSNYYYYYDYYYVDWWMGWSGHPEWLSLTASLIQPITEVIALAILIGPMRWNGYFQVYQHFSVFNGLVLLVTTLVAMIVMVSLLLLQQLLLRRHHNDNELLLSLSSWWPFSSRLPIQHVVWLLFVGVLMIQSVLTSAIQMAGFHLAQADLVLEMKCIQTLRPPSCGSSSWAALIMAIPAALCPLASHAVLVWILVPLVALATATDGPHTHGLLRLYDASFDTRLRFIVLLLLLLLLCGCALLQRRALREYDLTRSKSTRLREELLEPLDNQPPEMRRRMRMMTATATAGVRSSLSPHSWSSSRMQHLSPSTATTTTTTTAQDMI